MENLNTLCLADKYGEEPTDIPNDYWNKMRYIISTLYENEGIEYIDITPYNFIEKNEQMYLIDFGHAIWSKPHVPMNWFLKEFLNPDSPINEYNPDFK